MKSEIKNMDLIKSGGQLIVIKILYDNNYSSIIYVYFYEIFSTLTQNI